MQVKHSRSTHSPAQNQAGPQAATRNRNKRILFLVALFGIAIGCWYALRERSRKAERLAMLETAREHQPDASTALLASLKRHPDDAEVLEALVEWQLWAKAPFAEIEPHLDRFCMLRPDDLNGLRVRARLRIQNGRFAEGLADGLRVVEADPGDRNTRKLVAIAANEAGRSEIAVRELTTLLESSPLAQSELAAMLIRIHLQAGNAAESERVLNRYFAKSDDTAATVILRGRVHQVAERHEAAMTSFQSAANASVEHREAALYHLIESQRALGREADATRTLDELERVKARQQVVSDGRQQPDNMMAQIRAARQLLEDGKPAEAAALLENAMHRLGKNVDAATVLVQAYRQTGRGDLAGQWQRFIERP